jgi:hypothetical protein
MKSTRQQARFFGSGELLKTFALASLASSLIISPAFAEKDNGHGRDDQHGNNGQRHSDQAQRHDQRHDDRGQRPEYRRPYNYEQPVYVPPPVYYEPRQSPGIRLFFPLELRR